MPQYVYTLRRVGRVVPPKRAILRNISLNFFPGAKIGVLGLNGAGKSTLLRIMAGVDRDFEGEVVQMPNMRIGFLPQEPQLDAAKTVREAVEEGMGEVFDAKKKLEAIYAAYAEPDADFDKLAAEQAKLEAFLQKFPGTVIAVTHDRYFLDNAAQWILELDRGYGIPWEGNYSSWLEQKEKRLEIEEKQELARFKELSSYEYQKRNETQEIFIPVADRLGDSVIEFKGISKGYGDRLLIDDLSFSVPPGAIVGIIGPNGAGKSTLFRMITGKEKADKGKIVIGPTVKMAHVDQSREALEADKNVWEFISGGADILTVGKFEMPSRAYLGRFNIKGADQQKKLGTLSGGERGRVHLAKTMLKGGNVLLLDEPSNDLDVETLRALEDALLEFAGCVMVISHDRWFLDRIANPILAFEGDSKVSFFAGNYQEYETDKVKRLGEEGAKPRRIRYKPLKR